MYESPAHSRWLVPSATMLATVIIGGSVAYALLSRPQNTQDDDISTLLDTNTEGLVPPVTENDYIRGDVEAPIVFVTYSDLECPFCKDFHATMQKLFEVYGTDGSIAWVFRHFPLAQLHTKAPTEALASECVGKIAGNDAFWRFIDLLYAEGPGSDRLDLGLLPIFAERAGAESSAFQACMTEGELMNKVETQFQEATTAGGTGTPFTVVLVAGQQIPLDGAQPYLAMNTIVRTLLRNTGAAEGTLVPPSEAPPIDESVSIAPPTSGARGVATSTGE